jgi:hypothetical protein
VEGPDFIQDFIEKGVQPEGFSVFTSYSSVLFDNGTPLVGDILQPFIDTT